MKREWVLVFAMLVAAAALYIVFTPLDTGTATAQDRPWTDAWRAQDLKYCREGFVYMAREAVCVPGFRP